MSPLERARDELAQRTDTFPVITGATVGMVRPWPLPHLTDTQRHERALIEARMRAGQLRRLPTCFGELS